MSFNIFEPFELIKDLNNFYYIYIRLGVIGGNIRMGRPRSKDICPKCKKQGYLEYYNTSRNFYRNHKYWRYVHYDSVKRKRIRHYVGIITDLKKIRSVAYLKQQIKELEIENHNYRRYNFEISQEYKKIYERLESKIKKGVIKGKSKLIFENKVIPVKYQFFTISLHDQKLTIAVDNSKKITNLD